MLAHLTAAFRQIGVRRAVSVLCAVAFLAFTFVHVMHHCASADTAPSQIELTTLDGSSDGSDKSAMPDHCCNCSTATMIAAETALPVAVPAARVEPAVWQMPRPHTPATEFRPPIA